MYFIEFGALYVFGRLFGLYTSVSDFASRSSLDPTLLYLLARATTALLGAGTVWLVYCVGKAAYNKRVGLISAWLLAVCFIHVRDSHYATNDVPATLFNTAVLLYALQILRTESTKWYLRAGLALGIGFATKYSVALSGTAVIMAYVFSLTRSGAGGGFRRKWGFLSTFVLAAIVSAILASPYFVLSPARVLKDVYEALYLPGKYGFEGWAIEPAGAYIFYLKSLSWGLGWLLLAVVLAGVVRALRRFGPEDAVLVVYSLLVFLVIGSQRMFFARFLLPIVPPLLVLGASFVEDAVSRFCAHMKPRTRQACFVSVAVVVGLQPTLVAVAHDRLLTQMDTRTIAKEWIEAHVAPGSRVTMDWAFHGPPLSTRERRQPGSRSQYDVLIVRNRGLSDHPLAWYGDRGYEYIVTSSYISDLALSDRRADEDRKAFYRTLDQELQLLVVISPSDRTDALPFVFDEIYGPALSVFSRERPGPTIKVFSLRKSRRVGGQRKASGAVLGL